jgi:hypothetical protein
MNILKISGDLLYSQVPKDLNSLPGCRGYQAGQDGINHWVIDYSQVPKDLNSLPGCRGYQAGQDGINHWVIDYIRTAHDAEILECCIKCLYKITYLLLFSKVY